MATVPLGGPDPSALSRPTSPVRPSPLTAVAPRATRAPPPSVGVRGVALELAAGSAGFSAALREAGVADMAKALEESKSWVRCGLEYYSSELEARQCLDRIDAALSRYQGGK